MGVNFAYGPRNDEESIATVKRALELGINFWDTPDMYPGATCIGMGANNPMV